MKTFRIKLADITAQVHCQYPETQAFCRDYLTDSEPQFAVTITEDDVNAERKHFFDGNRIAGFYLEELALYRKLAEKLITYQIYLLHGSAIAVDGEVYVFIAVSGTGKSTHTALWRKLLTQQGHEVLMVNDDKPLMKLCDDRLYACGTPWNGQYRLSSDVALPVKAICSLNRSPQNHIEAITPSEAFPTLLQQTYRPGDPELLIRTLDMLQKSMKRVTFYRLDCNMEDDAAVLSYQTMKNKENENEAEKRNADT